MKSKTILKDDLELYNCARNIRPPKLIRGVRKDSLWWENQFKELEKESRTPDFKKLKFLKRIYTDQEIEGFSTCGLQVIEDTCCRRDTQELFQQKRGNVGSNSKFGSTSLKPTQYFNPFLEFMNKPKTEARTWYPSVEDKLEELPCNERAKRIERNIVRRFVKSFEDIPESDEINEQSVRSIYEITCPFPVSSALREKNQIFSVVPETTANHLGCHELSNSNKLITQIHKDIEASERPPSKTAFGKTLPPELRRGEFKEKPASKWEEQNVDHQSIETFAEVWKNITDLESTRKFCLYLLDHPNVTPPPFLLQEGMLIRKILKKPVYLGLLEKQYEKENTSEIMNINKILDSVKNTRINANKANNEALSTPANSETSLEISEIKIIV